MGPYLFQIVAQFVLVEIRNRRTLPGGDRAASGPEAKLENVLCLRGRPVNFCWNGNRIHTRKICTAYRTLFGMWIAMCPKPDPWLSRFCGPICLMIASSKGRSKVCPLRICDVMKTDSSPRRVGDRDVEQSHVASQRTKRCRPSQEFKIARNIQSPAVPNEVRYIACIVLTENRKVLTKRQTSCFKWRREGPKTR